MARFFGVSVETVRLWRKRAKGPVFRKVGALVRYDLSDLQRYWNALPSGGGQQPQAQVEARPQ